MEHCFPHLPVPSARRHAPALKASLCLALAASGLSPALSAPGLASQTFGQVLELVGAGLRDDDVAQVEQPAEIDDAACVEGSGPGWRPPDEAFTDAPDVLDGNPCNDSQVAGSGTLSDGRSRTTGWFAGHRIGDALHGSDPVGISALSLPADGAWRGADLRLLSVAWSGHQAVMGMAVQTVDGIANDFASAPAPGADYRVGLYARDDWQLSPALAAALRLRLDHDVAGNTQFRPRFGLFWQAGPTTRIKALYGRDRRAPTPGERDYGDGSILNANPLAWLEQTEALEFEAEQRVGSGLKLHAMAYAWTVRDIAALGLEPLPQVPAGEAVEARGFELSADQVWAIGARLRGSASLQDAVCTNGTPLLASPQWLGKLLLSTPLPWAGLRLGYEWLYDGERIGFDGSTVGAFAQSNLNLASTQLAKGLEWSMSVLNLFDMRDPRLVAAGNGLVALDQGRRNVQMRLAYEF